MIISFFDFIRTVISRLQSGALSCPDSTLPIVYENHSSSPSLPSVVPIGAPWQQVFLLARRQKKIYVELNFSGCLEMEVLPYHNLLFISAALLFRFNDIVLNMRTLAVYYLHWRCGEVWNGGCQPSLQYAFCIHWRTDSVVSIVCGDLALRMDPAILDRSCLDGVVPCTYELAVRDENPCTKELQRFVCNVVSCHRWSPFGFKCGINYQPPMEEFGSPAGVIGNPMGFASNVGLDIKDFLSVTSKGILLPYWTHYRFGTRDHSLLSNTVYAISDAATQGKPVKLHTRLAALRLDLDEEMIVSFSDFIRTVISRFSTTPWMLRNGGIWFRNTFASVIGMAPGTPSLLSNTVYAISDAATHGNSVKLHARFKIPSKDFHWGFVYLYVVFDEDYCSANDLIPISLKEDYFSPSIMKEQLRLAALCLDLDEEMIVSFFDFIKNCDFKVIEWSLIMPRFHIAHCLWYGFCKRKLYMFRIITIMNKIEAKSCPKCLHVPRKSQQQSITAFSISD
ncbi:hypothetical protein HHK36_001976 [Tetracentron sinense]|uniref:Uncharacterized protein n=1 Tax=Tetracentron sinense TaxID=13715 RepID=A0A834ZZ06_TETSI|nr:hypothetical protein HHK36_001976 [Tetracentron sinense]